LKILEDEDEDKDKKSIPLVLYSHYENDNNKIYKNDKIL